MFIPKEISPPEVHSRHAMELCSRCAALESEVKKRPFGFYVEGRKLFRNKNEKKIQVSGGFFQKKNIQDRLNAIVRFVLCANKNTGLCREKNVRPENIFLPRINIKWSLP